jgi:biotin synthase-like enzyme
MSKEEVLAIARRAQASGVTRICMGAAWREVRDNAQFERVLDMVRDVTAMGLEVCCTLGMLSESQAKRLEEAGCMPTTITSTRRPSITRRSSRRGRIRNGSTRWRTCGRRT